MLDRDFQIQFRVLLVVPKWPRKPWFTRILSLLYDMPSLIHPHPDLLKMMGTDIYHPDPEFLKLTSWPISGEEVDHQEFQIQSANLCWQPGEEVLRMSTPLSTESSEAGVWNGRLIPLLLL